MLIREIITPFLEWLEKNGRLTSLDPTAGKLDAPRDTENRGTRSQCILNGGPYAPGAYRSGGPPTDGDELG